MIVLICAVTAAIAVVVLLAWRALSTPERRKATHERSLAALRRAEQRLDDLSAEMNRVEGASVNTRRAVRRQALDREARRAVRAHKFQEARVNLTERLVTPQEQ